MKQCLYCWNPWNPVYPVPGRVYCQACLDRYATWADGNHMNYPLRCIKHKAAK